MRDASFGPLRPRSGQIRRFTEARTPSSFPRCQNHRHIRNHGVPVRHGDEDRTSPMYRNWLLMLLINNFVFDDRIRAEAAFSRDGDGRDCNLRRWPKFNASVPRLEKGLEAPESLPRRGCLN